MKLSILATALAIAASGAQALAISREVDSKLAARSMNDLDAREDSNPVLVARGIHPRFLGEDSAYTRPTGIRQKCSAVASRLSRVAHSPTLMAILQTIKASRTVTPWGPNNTRRISRAIRSRDIISRAIRSRDIISRAIRSRDIISRAISSRAISSRDISTRAFIAEPSAAEPAETRFS
ncbi:uncharacterized protein PgNI_07190 [Pyricularia grisea]|uniref:Uncharacterized protein n=1 Tax=Pyricularia grisea TaxID=148305 RepID=A0A6P8B0V1_PYRGI|nr:uncharacterized protein PgNI_07190 [Pyricularia grisea]TLD08456.1 hypothetical protein PgNI_07190 [Pyricularia grisea]